MNTVLGDLLPLAIGVAVSPIPIIATILMLLAPRAGGTGAGFLLGWVVGVAAVTTRCVAAGTVVGVSTISVGEQAIAVSTVAAPVIAYAVARERMRGPLDELHVWLQTHNAAVMSVLLLVIGVVLVGKGIGGL